MAVLKCKMCGGNLEIQDNQSYGTCDSCGSTMTLPKVNDEKILNLFNRADSYRRANEFDKALSAFESILAEDGENAEAYWGCVLARYGIEYVEDTKTRERIPTCHRVQNESILVDVDYQNALKYAPDNHSQELYKAEAERIAEIQKGILNVARNEKPYDVFICYKETDEAGKRTIDSTLAQDIYYQLTNDGYKVFFARITLEDRLGREYEPYIFAALNSAKVMLVIGTKPEFFNAVWVKNEWSRFLAMTKNDREKLIIPCYRDMDAYNLPEELSMFQSQDMSKIGFIQDLTRGIKKILKPEKEAAQAVTVVTAAPTVNVDALSKRAYMMLEDGEVDSALGMADKILNEDAENFNGHMIIALAELKVKTKEQIKNLSVLLKESNKFMRALKYAKGTDKVFLEECITETADNYCGSILEQAKKVKSKRQLDGMMAQFDNVPECGKKEPAKNKIAKLTDKVNKNLEAAYESVQTKKDDFKAAQNNARDTINAYYQKHDNTQVYTVIIVALITIAGFIWGCIDNGFVTGLIMGIVFLVASGIVGYKASNFLCEGYINSALYERQKFIAKCNSLFSNLTTEEKLMMAISPEAGDIVSFGEGDASSLWMCINGERCIFASVDELVNDTFDETVLLDEVYNCIEDEVKLLSDNDTAAIKTTDYAKYIFGAAGENVAYARVDLDNEKLKNAAEQIYFENAFKNAINNLSD